MFLQRHSIALTLAGAVAALLGAVAPADAAPRGGSWGGGFYGGSGISAGFYGGRGYYGGRDWDGGRGWYGGYNPGYYGNYGYWGGSRFGVGTYPWYYNGYQYGYSQPYYATPSTTTITVQPNDSNVTQAGYAEPAAPDNRAHIEVRVPSASAEIFFGGEPTLQTGTDRVFVSPPLDPGKTNTYSIDATWMNDNGKLMNKTRTVTVTPNQAAVVDFNNK